MIELCVLLFPGLVCPLEVSVSSGSIQVARGQTAVLPCTFTTNAALTNLNVIWMVIPLSNANQPQQVGLFSLYFLGAFLFPTLFCMEDLYNAYSLVVPELYCPFTAEHALWILHESVFCNVFLADVHCVLGWMCSWGKCM